MTAVKPILVKAAALILLVGCSGGATRVNDLPLKTAGAPVISEGYRHITRRYIHAVQTHDVAINGMRGLTTIDPSVTVEEKGGAILVMHGGKQVASLGPGDPRCGARVGNGLSQAQENLAREDL